MGKRSIAVTGAGSGIGRATALKFAREGAATIVLIDIAADRTQAVAQEVTEAGANPVSIQCDVRDPRSCETAWAEINETVGRIDVLVSNAGVPFPPEPFVNISLDSWTQQIEINLTAHFVLGQLAARSMIAAGTGVILFTGTVAALVGGGDFAPYSASKAGLLTLMRVMAIELAASGVRVNAVSPGSVDTPFTAGFVRDEERERARRSFPVIPMNRIGRPEEVADALCFLASDDASYITGHNLVVDGGLVIQLGRGRAWPTGDDSA